jgi:hypothetical protein
LTLSLREYLNKNPRVAYSIAGAAALLGIGLAAWTMWGGGGGGGVAGRSLPHLFYTVDDGKTYFPETIDKVPPFTTADNKTAYRAWVFKCKTGEPFVAYVEKYGDAEKKRLEGLFNDPAKRAVAVEAVMSPTAATTLLKKPGTGDTGWVSPGDGAKYEALLQPTCPDGGKPTLMFPQT